MFITKAIQKKKSLDLVLRRFGASCKTKNDLLIKDYIAPSDVDVSSGMIIIRLSRHFVIAYYQILRRMTFVLVSMKKLEVTSTNRLPKGDNIAFNTYTIPNTQVLRVGSIEYLLLPSTPLPLMSLLAINRDQLHLVTFDMYML